MNCKVCLKEIEHAEFEGYHPKCLKRLFGSPRVVPFLDFDKNQFETQMIQKFSRRMSISGIQEKLSVRLEGKKIVPTDLGGTYILKPAPSKYPHICENEHVTMRIAALLGIETAECGLVSFNDGELAYITKRFDRDGETKIPQEDMAQILEKQQNQVGEQYKYEGSYEQVAKAILNATGKPGVVLRFYERLIFNYLIANGDYHLKNISLQHMEADGKYRQLTPLYNSVNTRIHILNESRDLALDDLFEDGTAFDFMEFALRIGAPKKAVEPIFKKIKTHKTDIENLINASYLTAEMKMKYLNELGGRYARLFERF